VYGRVVFRADASPQIGGGHIVRCLALADRLAAEGWTCTFAVSSETLGSVPALASSRHHVHVVECLADAAFLSALGPVDLLVVDHYGLDESLEAPCREMVRAILVIEDLANRKHHAEILVDATFGRTKDDYRELVPPDCRLLLGPDYALLRPEFAATRSAALARRSESQLQRILVCMGNSDPHDVTSLALDAIDRCGRPFDVDVVLGSASPNRDAVAVRLRGARHRLHVDSRDVAGLMREADVAISSCGTIAWERCVLGLPAVAVITADNQRVIAQNLANAGAIVLAGAWDEVTANHLHASLARLAAAPERLGAMASAAAKICDGDGTRRVSRAVAELAS
jgi:UDP-2,4-diacetamido-2,4,6-trideoxy-beta-L-altropyranose hydrolase